ncbi:MAG TPA: ATP-dependent DNA helicase RecG [Trichormus sp.]
MPVIGDKKSSKELELSALRRAIAVERRSRYADFQGKRSTFSQFMRQTADKLCRRYPHEHVWTTIRALFRQYPNVDVATRISIMKRVEELLIPLWETIEVNAQIEKEATAPDIPVELSKAASAPTSWPPPAANAVSQKSEPGASANRERAKIVAPAPAQPPAKRGATIDQQPVQFVKGVGPKFAAVLDKLGIRTVEDLLRHYPRRHLDFQNRVFIRQLEAGQEVTVFGAIRSTSAYQSKNRNISILTVTIHDGTGSLNVTKFIGGRSNKYLLDRYKDQFPKGANVIASGIAERDKFSNRMTLKNGEIEVLGFTAESDDDDTDSASASIHAGRLVPVYPLTEGISLKHVRNVIYNALEAFGSDVKDHLPVEIMERLNLCDLRQAYQQIHFPRDMESFELARRRLVFDELFSIQLQMAQRRHKFDKTEGALSITCKEGGYVERLLQSLPFTLTGAQKRVFGQITNDLASPKPMHRLVQGDVGSGKTIVALLALMIAIENKFQGVIMAPTEILAEQHFRQFQKLITPLGLRVCLVVGKQGVKERREVRQQLLAGQINLAVGTHALLEEDVEFQNLGLIIIDEQHRFGVKQRARLKAKSQSPELLTMTATPIPRTLALTMHGDLDVSEIDELPPGRKPVETKLLRPGQKKQLLQFIRQQIDAGRQAYVVFPLIEESESLSAKAATQEFERLKEEKDFAKLSIGLMHGKLKPQEKDEVMDQFRNGEFQILVCTTVIEVGVDVPNATVMVIENADRFGLAQLHQLRGRVGRGAQQSFCFLIADAKSEPTRERLGIMEQTNDGFVIAEKDLELRGPGEFMGYRQSGLPDLILADLVKDARTLEEARNTAIELVKEDPELAQYPLLQQLIARKAVTMEPEIMRSG